MTDNDYTPRHAAEDDLTPIEDQKPPALLFSNRTYDIGKYVAQVLLPAAGTLYFALATIWGLPAANEVVGSIVAVDTFLGAILLLSSKSYDKSDAKYDGVVNVIQREDNTKKMTLELNAHPDDLEQKKDISFKVVNK